jgi:hypothetical protein
VNARPWWLYQCRHFELKECLVTYLSVYNDGKQIHPERNIDANTQVDIVIRTGYNNDRMICFKDNDNILADAYVSNIWTAETLTNKRRIVPH